MWWCGLLVVGVVLVSWAIGSTHQLLYPEHHRDGLPPSMPATRRHRLTAPDGAPLDVWVLAPPAPRGRLLLCHGYYADHTQVLALADALCQRGFEALLFELRGHGGRRGPCTFGIKEAEDAQAVLAWARESTDAKRLPVGVLGWSMGGAVVCQVALREPDVRAVVVDSVYARFFPVLQHAIWRRYHLPSIPWAWITWGALQIALGRQLSATDPAVLAPRLHQSLFAIHSSDDARVDPRLGAEFYERWAGPKEQWLEPAANHVGAFAKDPARYCNRVARFFERTLA